MIEEVVAAVEASSFYFGNETTELPGELHMTEKQVAPKGHHTTSLMVVPWVPHIHYQLVLLTELHRIHQLMPDSKHRYCLVQTKALHLEIRMYQGMNRTLLPL